MILLAITAMLLLLLAITEVAVVHWAVRLLDAVQGASSTQHQILITLGCLAVGCLPAIVVFYGLRGAWRANRTDVGQAILVAGGTLLLMVFASGFSMQEMSGWVRQSGPSPRATLGEHM